MRFRHSDRLWVRDGGFPEVSLTAERAREGCVEGHREKGSWLDFDTERSYSPGDWAPD
jgi:hypothetical protein